MEVFYKGLFVENNKDFERLLINKDLVLVG